MCNLAVEPKEVWAGDDCLVSVEHRLRRGGGFKASASEKEIKREGDIGEQSVCKRKKPQEWQENGWD